MSADFDLNEFGNSKDLQNNNQTTDTNTVINKEIEVPRRQSEQNLTYSYTQWSEIFFNTFVASGASKNKLPAGLYTIKRDDYGRYNFVKKSTETDELINFSDSVSDKILQEIERFWKLNKEFEQYKFLHRRGYLLYGPPGGGKSAIVQQIIEGIIKNNGIAIWADGRPYNVIEATNILRTVESERAIVVIFEDIDAIIDKWGESDILSYLDGEGNINKILNIATTNYPKKLDKRIVARPRRFDRVERIGMPSSSIRKEFFKYKLKGLDEEELDRWTRDTKDFSFAALTDLIISVKCFKYSYEEAIEKLQKLLVAKFKDNEQEFKETQVGFSQQND